MTVTLIGGGWDPQAADALYAPFAAEVRDRGSRLVCFLQEGVDPRRWLKHLRRFGLTDVAVVDVRPEHGVPANTFADVDGVMVCGGRNPLYQRSLVTLTPELAAQLRNHQLPYLGFSAGAAVGGRYAVCGGHQLQHEGRSNPSPVAPPKYNEGLTDLTLEPGFDLVPFAIDVHATQAGTLPRLLHAVAAGLCPEGWSMDADAGIHVDPTQGSVTVAGTASVYRIRAAPCTAASAPADPQSVIVDILTPGTVLMPEPKLGAR